MGLDGFLADAELRRDLLVRHPVNHPLDDLLPPLGQGLPQRRQGGIQPLHPLEQAVHHLAQHLALGPELPGVGRG